MKRFLACLTAGGFALSAIAKDGFAGTKLDPIPAATSAGTSPVGIMPMVQMVVALVIVGGLVKFILPKVAGKLNKRLVTNLNSVIKVEESAQFAGGSLYIVQAKSKSLLLSVTATGVTCLADVTESAASPPDPPSFFELVEEAGQRPVDELEAAVVQRPEPAPAEIEAALDRLRRLSS